MPCRRTVEPGPPASSRTTARSAPPPSVAEVPSCNGWSSAGTVAATSADLPVADFTAGPRIAGPGGFASRQKPSTLGRRRHDALAVRARTDILAGPVHRYRAGRVEGWPPGESVAVDDLADFGAQLADPASGLVGGDVHPPEQPADGARAGRRGPAGPSPGPRLDRGRAQHARHHQGEV